MELDLGMPFGVLAGGHLGKLVVITKNEDLSVGDIFLIPSSRGEYRYFIFRISNFENIIRRLSSIDTVAETLVVEKDAYLANLEEEKLIAVEGSLLGYGKYHDKDNKFVFKKARRLPEHFSAIYKVQKVQNEDSLKDILASQLSGDIFVGDLLVGEESLNIDVMIPKGKIPMHVGIFGATGYGKSNLMQVITKSFIDYNLQCYLNGIEDRITLLTIDPHDEYALGTGKFGIQDIIDEIDSRSSKVRRELFGDFYYLTTSIDATARDVQRYAKKLKISLQEILPIDLMSIHQFTPPQIAYMYSLHAVYGDEWINNVGDAQGFMDATVNAVERYLAFLRRSNIFLDGYAGSNLLDVVSALEMGRVLLFNTSITSQREQFLSTTIIARTVFELRKAVKSSNTLDILKKQIATRDLSECIRKDFSQKNLIQKFYLKDQTTVKDTSELVPILITVEEAPSILTPDLMRFEGNVYKAISRQGRKFGIGLAVISQQVSSINPALLSQLNTQIVLALGNADEIRLAIKAASRDISDFESEFKVLDRGEAVVTASYRDLPFVVHVPLFDDRFKKDSAKYTTIKDAKDPKVIL
ncbi:ATP-binding protein [Candidatus Borrarchaeum sp.]|uniref:ATP-binding protein n=1 Tax=Candidatus Borrarchaeum sp. TaxID=2846742 RepID=UPI00257B6BCE|nr:ATP-binding protein [Candidatus Borrarchaeum sp.]